MTQLQRLRFADRMEVTIPASLHETIRERIDRTAFADPDAYVEFVLEEVLASLERSDGGEVDRPGSREVEQRLRALGYA